jgi:extradiol dioxygenase
MDDRHHRIAVHPGDEDGLAYIGWELRDQAAFRAACAELEAAGLSIRLGEPDERSARAVQAFAQFSDPAGYVHEIFYAPTFTPGSFRPGKPMAGPFVAGEAGVGHVVVVVPEFTDELERFATEVLGFELYAGYLAPAPDGRLLGPQFYRCNGRSHCFAYIAIPGMRGMQHLCIEAESLDDVGRAYDIVNAQDDIPLTMTLGRHALDSLVSFYLRTPTGFDMEFGAGGAAIDDASFVMLNPSSPEVWGHQFVTPGWAPTVRPVEPQEA